MNYYSAQSLLASKLEDVDEDKIDRLFANLRPKDKDTKKWKDQTKFWSKLIKHWGKDSEVIEFSVDTLTQYLNHDQLIPQLKPALDYLVSIGILKTHEDVVSKKSFISSLSSKVLGFIWPSSSTIEQDKYVFVDNLKDKVNSIISDVESSAVYSSDIVLTTKELEERYRDDSKYPFDLILSELDRNKHVKRFSNGYYFDVGRFSDYNFGDDVIQAIIGSKDNIRLLDEKIDIIEKQMDYDLNKARAYKKQNREKEAKTALVHKKMLENVRNNYYKMKSNLENTLNQFEESHTVKKVANALKSVSEAMKTIEMPTMEEVDDVIDSMQDYNEVTDQIASAFQPPELANMDEEIDEDFLNLPTGEEEAQPAQKHNQPNETYTYNEIPQAEMPQAEPVKLKTPKQLAHNPLLQYY